MADVPCPLGMLLDAVAIAIARMDFEVESHDLAATANHVTRCRSLDDAAQIRWLAAGVREACRTQGRDGVSTWAMVADLARLVADAIEATGKGDGEPWLTVRGRVRELLGEIITAAPSPDAVVMRTAAPATPIFEVERRAATAGEKGEKGGKPVSAPSARTANGRRILSMLLEHGAIQEEDRVTREYIADESRLTIEKVRRAIEHDLKPGGLIESKLGRDGGLWLAQAGIAAAQSLAAK